MKTQLSDLVAGSEFKLPNGDRTWVVVGFVNDKVRCRVKGFVPKGNPKERMFNKEMEVVGMGKPYPDPPNLKKGDSVMVSTHRMGMFCNVVNPTKVMDVKKSKLSITGWIVVVEGKRIDTNEQFVELSSDNVEKCTM